MDRKRFIKMAGLAIPALNLKSASGPSQKPIVVSTWDSGMAVNAEAWKILGTGGRALDAVEAGAMQIEDTINCCVGLGGYPDRDGIVTLDSCIMDEHSNCGAVAGLEQIKHPVSVARKVMENTPPCYTGWKRSSTICVRKWFQKRKWRIITGRQKSMAGLVKKFKIQS